MIDRIARATARLALALFIASSPAWAGSTNPHTVHLLTGELTPAPGVPAATLALVAAKAAPGQKRHVLVQLHGTPSPELRSALAAGGLELQGYVSGRAWIAAVAADKAASALTQPQVRWAMAWDGPSKLHPRLAAKQIGAWARSELRPGEIKLFVQLHRDVALDRGAELAKELGGFALPPVAGLHGLAMWLPESRLNELAGREEVLWVEEAPARLSAMNDAIRRQMGVDQVNGWPGSLDAEGIKILVYDDGTAQEDHPTFSGSGGSRLTLLNEADPSDHATHVAGTAAGNGTDSDFGRGRGVAYGASVISAGLGEDNVGFNFPFVNDLLDLEKDYAEAVEEHGIDLANNSIGLQVSKDWDLSCGLHGDYQLFGALVDGIVRGDNPEIPAPLIVTWAASNERGNFRCGSHYATLGPPACAKNPITVGAVHSDGGAMSHFSGWGPCDDDRLKPVVVAPGCESGRMPNTDHGIYSSVLEGVYASIVDPQTPWCGTSMAAPAVTGTVAAFIQRWRELGFGQENQRPLPALVKALLIHTARDRGQLGPDYTFGYGLVDAEAFIELLGRDDGKLGNGNDLQWGTAVLTAEGAEKTYSIFVPSNAHQLRSTLAWDDAVPNQFAYAQLVNDLRLELVAPDGTVHQAWVLGTKDSNFHLPAGRGDNTLDNQEQVVVDDPQAGWWTVRVSAPVLPEGPQSFGLIYSAELESWEECRSQTWDFDEGSPDWTLNGAKVIANPDGSGSVLALDDSDTATLPLTLPGNLARAELSFSWRMTTWESGGDGDQRDFFRVEVRRPGTGEVFAVLDERDHGWPEEVWMEAHYLDLTPWQGQTIDLVLASQPYFGTTTYHVDDVHLTFCDQVAAEPALVFTPGGTEDGTVTESAEDSGVGGSFVPASSSNVPLSFGDDDQDRQVKVIVSFDTSAIPDDFEITGAVLRLSLWSWEASGLHPMVSHWPCWIDVDLDGFGATTALAAEDFEAPADFPQLSVFGYASDPLEWSYANLYYDPFPIPDPPDRVNKTGTTQVRISCDGPRGGGDDDEGASDLMHYYNALAKAGLRPELIVTYND
ncbi:MAG TPA: S8 family serine peptidase [Thermoanaerobaculia bacterium]|nr:S8 family serine peptidase [Thermoanaerobaculia bacterium]